MTPFQHAYRARVGAGKLSTQDLASRLGVTPRRTQGWLTGPNEPSLIMGLLITREIGCDFLNELANPLGMGGLHRLDGEGCYFEIIHELAATVSLATDFLQDGKLSHNEQKILTAELRQLRVTIGELLHRTKGPVRVAAE